MALDYNVIGERIKIARKCKRFTQEELSEKMGVSTAFLSRIERGSSHINLNRLSQICSILGITEGNILNGTSVDSSAYLNKEFADLLNSCSSEKQKLIYEMARLISNS